MAKITFVGSGEPNEPGRVTWGIYTFELNKPIDVTDPHIIAKAMNNKHFQVSGNGTVGKVKVEAEEAEEDQRTTAGEKESATIARQAAYPVEEPEEDEDQPAKRGPGRPRKVKDEAD